MGQIPAAMMQSSKCWCHPQYFAQNRNTAWSVTCLTDWTAGASSPLTGMKSGINSAVSSASGLIGSNQ